MTPEWIDITMTSLQEGSLVSVTYIRQSQRKHLAVVTCYMFFQSNQYKTHEKVLDVTDIARYGIWYGIPTWYKVLMYDIHQPVTVATIH